MPAPAEKFKFLVGEKVLHCESDRSTFMVTRRWLDVDAPEGANRFYELRDNKPLFGQGKIDPVLESELSLAPETHRTSGV